jgi:hypothetical protein
MTDADAVALSVLSTRRAALGEIGRRLLDREVVDGDEVRKLVSLGSDKGVHAA